MFTPKDEAPCCLPIEKKIVPAIERATAFKAACRLTPWFSKKDEPRIIHTVENEEDYKRIIATMPHACEALDGGPVKAYLDIDHKVDLKDVNAVKGADGKIRYFEKSERSHLDRIRGEIARISLFNGHRFYAMTRESRMIKGDKLKISWRIIFPDLILENQLLLGTYLKAIGCTSDAPFDLSVYNKGRIMNAALCIKPNKEGDSPCPPLDPLLCWGGKLEDRLITVVDPGLPIVKIEKWMPKDVGTDEPKSAANVETSPSNAGDVEKLLSIISPNCSYERWFKVLCAIANTLGKNIDDTYELADAWSAQGVDYTPQSFGKTWSSIRDNGTLSIATLHYYAKEENAARYNELFPKGLHKGKKVDIYKSRDYADIKATFEETVFKVIKPVAFYQKKSDGSGYIITTEDKIKSAYRNVMYNKTVDTKREPKTVPFINDWLADPDMKLYDHTEFDPSRKVGDDVLNTFTGFAAERIPSVPDADVEGLVKPFLDHIIMLVGEDGAKFVMLWLANMFQNPQNMTCVGIVLHSVRQGTGKSLPFNYIGEKVLGKEWYKQTSDPIHDLFDKHSNGMSNRLLVQVEEASGADFIRHLGRLKDFVTTPNVRLERKGIDIDDFKNYANFIFTTNAENPIPIEANDRRFTVFDCNDARVGDVNYFSNLVDVMEKPEWARAMYQYLMGIRNLPRNFQNVRPLTAYYREIQRINIPNWAKYLAVKSVEAEREYKASEFYRCYTHWADANGYGQSKLTQTSFALKFKTIDGIQKTKSYAINYLMDWLKIVECLKKKNLWDEEAY